MMTKVTGIEREEHATDQLFLLVVASAVFVTTLTGSFEKSSWAYFNRQRNGKKQEKHVLRERWNVWPKAGRTLLILKPGLRKTINYAFGQPAS